MAKFSAKDIFFKDDDMAVFGTDQDSKLYWDGSANQLRLSTTISGVTPTQDYHLTTRQYVDELFSSASGIVSNDFLFIHDSTGGTETVSGWTDVPFDVVNKQTAAFSFTVSGSEVTINVAGTYVVTGKITMTDTNNDRISTYGRLVLNTGSGYSIVPGSLFALYQADGTVADATGNTTVILDLEDGDKLKLQADGSNASSTAPLIAGGSSLVVFSPAGEKGTDGTQGDQGDKGDTGFGLWASARVDGDGTVRNSYNLNVSRSATGTYDCTFNTVAPDAYYQLMGQPYQTVTDTNAMMSNVTASGFTITIGQGDNGGTPDTLADTDFSVVAFYSEGSPATSGVVDHGDLLGLEDDDHLQYVPRNGSRGFTSTVSGVDPTQSYHLATKQYVDSTVASGFDYTITEKFSVGNLQLDLSNAPFYSTVGPLGVLLFSPTTDQYVFGSFTVPDNYKTNSNIILKIKYMNASAQTGTNSCVWAIDYHSYEDGESYGSKTTTTVSTTDALPNNATVGTFQEASITMSYNDANNPLNSGDTITFRFYRDANNVSDDMSGTAALIVLAFDIVTEVE